MGSLTETRQLLYAALLIADDLKEVRAGAGLPDPTPPPPDPAVAEALERLARADGDIWPTGLSGAPSEP